MIVLSILIAFALDASWEARGERAEAREILIGLRADFTVSRSSLATWIGGHEQMDRVATELLDTLQATGSGAAANVPIALLYPLVGSGTWDPTTATLDALLNSGRLEMVNSPELRALLAGWPASAGDARAEEAVLASFVEDRLHQTVVSQVDLVEMELGRVDHFFPDDLPESFWTTEVRFQVTRRVINDVGRRVGLERTAIRELRGVEDAVRRILQLLESELE